MPLGRVVSWSVYGGAGGQLAEQLGLRVWVCLVCGGSPVLCRFLRDRLARRRCRVVLGCFSTFFCCICAHVAGGWGSGNWVPWVRLCWRIISPNAGGKACMSSLCCGVCFGVHLRARFDSVFVSDGFSGVVWSSRVCLRWRGG